MFDFCYEEFEGESLDAQNSQKNGCLQHICMCYVPFVDKLMKLSLKGSRTNFLLDAARFENLDSNTCGANDPNGLAKPISTNNPFQCQGLPTSAPTTTSCSNNQDNTNKIEKPQNFDSLTLSQQRNEMNNI